VAREERSGSSTWFIDAASTAMNLVQSPGTPADLKPIFRRILWRLMPFLVMGHALAAIDRINISFAKLCMAQDIALSETAYGLGAGIFYLGYLLLEVPSNLLLQRIGARATLTRIMLLWGVVTMGTAFVSTPTQLAVARFLLGVAEAGFFPGVILYLTYWFPAALRGRVTAVFLMAGIAAGAVSGPLAGWIMTRYDGWLGLKGWQALFVLEGIPAIALALFAWVRLADKPASVHWLSITQKQALADALAADAHQATAHARLRDVLTDPRVLVAGLVYFCIYSSVNTMAYWMPTLIRGLGVENLKTIGLLSSWPFIAAVIGMYLLGRSSDKRMERRWHVASTMLVSAACFLLLGFVRDQLEVAIVLMGLGAAAGLCAIPLFWTIPPAFLARANAAAGIAMISCMGNLSGVASQATVGAIKSATGSLYVAFDVIGIVLALGAVALLVLIPARHLRESRARRPITRAHSDAVAPTPSSEAP
jgi:sugar phosphate permease